MNKKKTVCYILMYLPLVVVLIVLPHLPKKIPAHYGFDNQVDRWGSKYEALLFPVVSILMGYCGRQKRKRQFPFASNEKS